MPQIQTRRAVIAPPRPTDPPGTIARVATPGLITREELAAMSSAEFCPDCGVIHGVGSPRACPQRLAEALHAHPPYEPSDG